MWNGTDGKPKNIKGVLYSDGSMIRDDQPLDSDGLSWLNTYQYESEWKYIVSYTLGEKRRRCPKYVFGDATSSGICPTCKGTGWEYK